MNIYKLFETKHRDRFIPRTLLYIAGSIVLAFGTTLNTKTNFGASPFISFCYTTSEILGINMGIMSFLTYLMCILGQFVLLRKEFKPEMLTQIIVSTLMGSLIGFFDSYLPVFESTPTRILGLVTAIISIGIGSSIVVDMKLIANPADSFANIIGIKLGRGLGFGKNVFDVLFISVSTLLGLIFRGKIMAIGIGTVCCMIFTGRAIAVFQHFFKEKLEYFI